MNKENYILNNNEKETQIKTYPWDGTKKLAFKQWCHGPRV